MMKFTKINIIHINILIKSQKIDIRYSNVDNINFNNNKYFFV